MQCHIQGSGTFLWFTIESKSRRSMDISECGNVLCVKLNWYTVFLFSVPPQFMVTRGRTKIYRGTIYNLRCLTVSFCLRCDAEVREEGLLPLFRSKKINKNVCVIYQLICLLFSPTDNYTLRFLFVTWTRFEWIMLLFHISIPRS